MRSSKSTVTNPVLLTRCFPGRRRPSARYPDQILQRARPRPTPPHSTGEAAWRPQGETNGLLALSNVAPVRPREPTLTPAVFGSLLGDGRCTAPPPRGLVAAAAGQEARPLVLNLASSMELNHLMLLPSTSPRRVGARVSLEGSLFRLAAGSWPCPLPRCLSASEGAGPSAEKRGSAIAQSTFPSSSATPVPSFPSPLPTPVEAHLPTVPPPPARLGGTLSSLSML